MNNQNNTILLFGMPRSGTTWIGKVFDSHPNTLYRHEPDSQKIINDILLFTHSQDITNDSIKLANKFFQEIPTINDSKVCAKTPFFPKKHLTLFQNFFLKLSIYLTKTPIKFLQSHLIYVPKYQEKTYHLVWKSIESLGRLNLLLKADKQAIGIHIIRHPCGYISSVLKGEKNNKFVSNCASSEDYGLFKFLLETETAKVHNLNTNYLKSLSPIERLAWKWVIYNDHTYEQCSLLDNYKIAYYDQLCSNTESGFRQLFDFSNLVWDRQIEVFINKSISANNTSYYSVYKDPKESSNKWRQDLNKEQIKTIMNIINKSKLSTILSF